MQREIKFRAWDKFRRIMCNHEDINIWDRFMKDDMSNQYSPLMQFTGLHDKNGKEIYEGDVLKDYDIGKTYQIFWFDKGWYLKDGTGYYFGTYFADQKIVVGNIYENPELLKEDTHE